MKFHAHEAFSLDEQRAFDGEAFNVNSISSDFHPRESTTTIEREGSVGRSVIRGFGFQVWVLSAETLSRFSRVIDGFSVNFGQRNNFCGFWNFLGSVRRFREFFVGLTI